MELGGGSDTEAVSAGGGVDTRTMGEADGGVEVDIDTGAMSAGGGMDGEAAKEVGGEAGSTGAVLMEESAVDKGDCSW